MVARVHAALSTRRLHLLPVYLQGGGAPAAGLARATATLKARSTPTSFVCLHTSLSLHVFISGDVLTCEVSHLGRHVNHTFTLLASSIVVP